MRWLRAWWRRRRPDIDVAAAAARRESERKLEEVQRMSGRIESLSCQLQRELDENHFAALVAAAFRARRP